MIGNLQIRVCAQKQNFPFGSHAETEADPKQAKKLEKQLKIMEGRKDKEEASKKHHHHHTFRGTAKAVNLAHKLSPKLQRKKEKNDQVAQLKVRTIAAIVCSCVQRKVTVASVLHLEISLCLRSVQALSNSMALQNV